ncbi:hypothetical protein BH18ACT9_BH18ACT9_18290 [soil metagenome]
MAAGVGLVSSVLLIFSLFDELTRIRSVEMRSAINDFLAGPPGDGLGLTPDGAVELLRGLVFVNGALAAVCAVLAVYVAQRHHVARIGFTVAAVLLLMTSPVTGGALAILVAFAASLLWARPARDWFAGRDPQQAPSRPVPAAFQQPPPRTGTSWAPPIPPADAPATGARDLPSPPSGAGAQPAPANYPFGRAPQPGWAAPAPDHQPQPAAAPAPPPGTAPAGWSAPAATTGRRPVTVTLAAVLTWVMSGGIALVFAGIVAMLMLGREALLEAVAQNPEGANLSTQDLLAGLWVLSAICLVWSLGAIVLAVLAFRRLNWARITLVVSAAVAGLLAAALSAVFGGGWVPLTLAAVAAVTVVLLFTGGANRWYADKPRPPHSSGGPPAPGQPGHQPPHQPPAMQEPRKRPQVW